MACQSIQQIDWLKGPMLPCATCAIGRHVARERSEEHTSELQSQSNLVCRLLLEKKKTRADFAAGQKTDDEVGRVPKQHIEAFVDTYSRFMQPQRDPVQPTPSVFALHAFPVLVS